MLPVATRSRAPRIAMALKMFARAITDPRSNRSAKCAGGQRHQQPGKTVRGGDGRNRQRMRIDDDRQEWHGAVGESVARAREGKTHPEAGKWTPESPPVLTPTTNPHGLYRPAPSS